SRLAPAHASNDRSSNTYFRPIWHNNRLFRQARHVTVVAVGGCAGEGAPQAGRLPSPARRYTHREPGKPATPAADWPAAKVLFQVGMAGGEGAVWGVGHARGGGRAPGSVVPRSRSDPADSRRGQPQ